MTKDGTIKML